MNISTIFKTPSSSIFQKKSILKVFLKTFQHFFGSFKSVFKGIDDPRMPRSDNYPLAGLFFTGICLFLSRIQAVRQIKYRLHTEAAKATFKTLFGKECIPHGDTLNTTFADIDPTQVETIPSAMIRTLIRKRVLDWGRFLNRYYLVAIDGTGVYVFHERHCEHCTTKVHNGKTVYYHMVLEAKLVTSDGLALSVMSEFIENPQENPSKQDCETKAFRRLAEKLKLAFPKLPMLLLLDGLFAEGPVFQICRENHWEFLIVLKDRDLPTVNQEFRNLRSLNPENSKKTYCNGVSHKYSWVNAMLYSDSQKRDHALNVLECLERLVTENTHRWISSIPITPENVSGLAKSGRSRWIIENQGFNAQKNSGFALEHTYSKDPVGMKVYYFLLQIAHIWIQLCERSVLLKKLFPKGFGSLKNISILLLEEWRNHSLSSEEWLHLCEVRIQFRFDTS